MGRPVVGGVGGEAVGLGMARGGGGRCVRVETVGEGVARRGEGTMRGPAVGLAMRWL